MMTPTLAALIAKRDEIEEAIRLLEASSCLRGGLAVGHMVDRLSLKAEWLNKRIQIELNTRAENAA